MKAIAVYLYVVTGLMKCKHLLCIYVDVLGVYIDHITIRTWVAVHTVTDRNTGKGYVYSHVNSYDI